MSIFINSGGTKIDTADPSASSTASPNLFDFGRSSPKSAQNWGQFISLTPSTPNNEHFIVKHLRGASKSKRSRIDSENTVDSITSNIAADSSSGFKRKLPKDEDLSFSDCINGSLGSRGRKQFSAPRDGGSGASLDKYTYTRTHSIPLPVIEENTEAVTERQAWTRRWLRSLVFLVLTLLAVSVLWTSYQIAFKYKASKQGNLLQAVLLASLMCELAALIGFLAHYFLAVGGSVVVGNAAADQLTLPLQEKHSSQKSASDLFPKSRAMIACSIWISFVAVALCIMSISGILATWIDFLNDRGNGTWQIYVVAFFYLIPSAVTACISIVSAMRVITTRLLRPGDLHA